MKNKSLLLICMAILILSGCGHSTKQESDSTAAAVNEMNADALLDLFIDGEIMAYYVDVDREPFYITDLPSDPGDFTCYSVGDRIDLDNDGENELIMNGPYGGLYLDARDGQIYVLDEGNGTALVISYTEFDGQTWIVHSDTTHSGRILYDFTLYDGAGHVVDERRLFEEYDELKMKMLGE